MKNTEKLELGKIFNIARGGSPRPIQKFITNDPNAIPWIKIGDTSEGSKYIANTKERIIQEGIKKSRIINPGDFLLTNSMSFGHPYISKIKGCIHDGWLVLSPNRKDIDPNYFYYLLGSDSVYQEFLKRASGTTVKNLNIDLVSSVKVSFPPIAEQKRIAAILDKADGIRRKRQQAIQLTEDLGRSVFLDMFGDPVTNPKGWKFQKLETISEKVIDCPHSTPKWSEEGVICLRTSNLTEGDWNWNDTRYVNPSDYEARTSRSTLQEGDIILSREGTVGVAAIVPPQLKLCMGQRLVQIRPNYQKITSEYLLFVLLWQLAPERLSKLMRGSTSKHLNVKDLRSLKIPIPSLEKQHQFLKKRIHIRNIYRHLSKHLTESENLFNSLLQRAFRGEL